MDTTEAAARLGTTPRILRQFLRSSMSTFVAVGSGSRYEFTDTDLPTLQRRFAEWKSGTKPKRSKSATSSIPTLPRKKEPSKRDVAVWEEEGPVVLPDIRNPRVRRRVLAQARAAEQELMMLLVANGMHIAQRGDSRKVS